MLALQKAQAQKEETKRSFAELLIKGLAIPRISACENCLGLGFVYLKEASLPLSAGRRRGFQLCSCIDHLCQAEHCSPPYERYDVSKQNMQPCQCRLARFALERIQLLEQRSAIPLRYAGCFLDDISIDPGQIPGAEKSKLSIALDHAMQIVSEYSSKHLPLGLYLSGGTGCGKTLLSCALLNELLRFHKISVRYAKTSRDILSKMRASYNPNSGIYGEGIRIEKELVQGKSPGH